MTEVERASARMFGPGGLGVTNINLTLGSRADITAEDIARQINRALDAVEAGDFELVDEESECPNSMFTRKQAREAHVTLRA